jgi:hypothetical protein
MTRDSAGSSYRGPSRVEVRCESLRSVEKGPLLRDGRRFSWTEISRQGAMKRLVASHMRFAAPLAHPRWLSRLDVGSERVEGADDALAGR